MLSNKFAFMQFEMDVCLGHKLSWYIFEGIYCQVRSGFLTLWMPGVVTVNGRSRDYKLITVFFKIFFCC